MEPDAIDQNAEQPATPEPLFAGSSTNNRTSAATVQQASHFDKEERTSRKVLEKLRQTARQRLETMTTRRI